MSISLFDNRQFFNETVLPTLATEPEYARASTLPLDYGIIPVVDFEHTERFSSLPCRLGYWPVHMMTEIGIITLDEAKELPKAIGLSTCALPSRQPLDGIAVARKRTHTVIGLRDAEAQTWQEVPGDRTTNRNILAIIRAKAMHPWNRGKVLEPVDFERIRAMRTSGKIASEAEVAKV
jgi:hypothetical protein